VEVNDWFFGENGHLWLSAKMRFTLPWARQNEALMVVIE
jgi:hypothetical protein